MSAKRIEYAIAMVTMLAMVASAFLLQLDYQGEREVHRSLLVTRAQTTLDALAAGLRAHGRMGRYRHERLAYIFEELAETRDVVGVALLDGAGKTIAGAGFIPEGVPFGVGDPQWASQRLSLCDTVALEMGGAGSGLGGGWGRGRMGDETAWEPLPEGPYHMVVSLDATDTLRAIDRERTRSLLAFGALGLVLSSAAMVAVGWRRRRALRDELVQARAQAARQSALAQLGAGLAHETKNPLGIVRGQAQLLADGGEEGERAARAQTIVDEIDRVVGHIDGFLKLAHPQALIVEAVALRPLLKALVALVADEAGAQGVSVVLGDIDGVVRADEGQLRRAVLNVLLNALQASQAGGRIEVSVTGGGRCAICVRDEGCGMDEATIERVVEPYFSRFPNGTGLGLAVVKQIMEAHGGALEIASQPERGTTVCLVGLEREVDSDG